MENQQQLVDLHTLLTLLFFMYFVKMSRVLSVLPLACVLVCCVCVRADLPRDFGVKLCGREFIRAVIFTCGGSRWRRATYSDDILLDRRDEFSASDEAPLLSDLLQLQTDARVATLFSSSRPERRKRNFSLGLAGLCCSQGCTKHDIGRLC